MTCRMSWQLNPFASRVAELCITCTQRATVPGYIFLAGSETRPLTVKLQDPIDLDTSIRFANISGA